ncbi:hypothetical protein GT037_011180 [Alternaria burnsii]|uniref:Transcription factor domain-containing protein n=1 Tax=Alternaria burnsii TaxID=1187904 RepID=A0A8H7E9W3_9PLEO|nr:uncharacterized protein GT037_011180 [Alternaria burnsii]KAF7670729.1 hypothetical protein GT037_011180 [Alternaria burnsii]
MTATGVGSPMTLAEEDIELQLHAERRYFESCHSPADEPSAARYQSAELNFMTASLSLMLFLRKILRAVYATRPVTSQSAALNVIEDKLRHYNTIATPPDDSSRPLIFSLLLRLRLLFNQLVFYRGIVFGRIQHEKRIYYEEALLSTVVEMCEVVRHLDSHRCLPDCPSWTTTALFHASAVLLNFYAGKSSIEASDTAIDLPTLIIQLIGNLEKMEETWSFAAWIGRAVRTALDSVKRKVDLRQQKQDPPTRGGDSFDAERSPLTSLTADMPLDDGFMDIFDWHAIFANRIPFQ